MTKACSNGHALESFVNSQGVLHACNGCHLRQIRVPEEVFRCERCDFHFCPQCNAPDEYVEDELVKMFSEGEQKWLDAKITNVFRTDCEFEGLSIKAGFLRVAYSSSKGKCSKYIPAEQVGTVIRKAQISAKCRQEPSVAEQALMAAEATAKTEAERPAAKKLESDRLQADSTEAEAHRQATEAAVNTNQDRVATEAANAPQTSQPLTIGTVRHGRQTRKVSFAGEDPCFELGLDNAAATCYASETVPPHTACRQQPPGQENDVASTQASATVQPQNVNSKAQPMPWPWPWQAAATTLHSPPVEDVVASTQVSGPQNTQASAAALHSPPVLEDVETSIQASAIAQQLPTGTVWNYPSSVPLDIQASATALNSPPIPNDVGTSTQASATVQQLPTVTVWHHPSSGPLDIQASATALNWPPIPNDVGTSTQASATVHQVPTVTVWHHPSSGPLDIQASATTLNSPPSPMVTSTQASPKSQQLPTGTVWHDSPPRPQNQRGMNCSN